MKKAALIILVTLIGLSSCNHKRMQNVELDELIAHEFIDSIIFQGYIKGSYFAYLKENGDVMSWSEDKPCSIKYTLDFVQGKVTLFSDPIQYHVIEEYFEKDEEDKNFTCYGLKVSNQHGASGELYFLYDKCGTAVLHVYYPNSMIVYILDHDYMQQCVFEWELRRFRKKRC